MQIKLNNQILAEEKHKPMYKVRHCIAYTCSAYQPGILCFIWLDLIDSLSFRKLVASLKRHLYARCLFDC